MMLQHEDSLPNRIGDPFDEFQIRIKENHHSRCHMTRNHFIEHITDIGGIFFENPFVLGPPELAPLKKALSKNTKEALKSGIEELKQESRLFSSFARLIFEGSRPELEQLNSFDGLDDDEIRQMAKACDQANQKRAKDLVDCWLFDQTEVGEIDAEIRISMIHLHSRLLLEVDKLLAPYFPNGVDTLLDWAIDGQQDTLEFFITGTPEADRFRNFVKENRHELKVSAFLDLGRRGWEESPLQIIENIGKLLFIDVKRLNKVSGRKNGKNIATEKKKALIGQYVKQKKLKKSLPDSQKKVFLMKSVIDKLHRQPHRMTRQETEYFRSIGDRIILVKRSHIPLELYSRIIASLIPPTEKIFETRFH